MKGIVIASHGKLCEGYIESAKLFFGEDLVQVETCPLEMDSDPDKYVKEVLEKNSKVNSGEGTYILLDLWGGTPANMVQQLLNKGSLADAAVITGVNFPMFLELLGQRLTGNYDPDSLVRIGQEGIRRMSAITKEKKTEEEADEEIL